MRYFTFAAIILAALWGGVLLYTSAEKPWNVASMTLNQENASVPVSTATTREPAASPSPGKTEDPIGKIEELKKCYESGACDFPQTDPRSYYFAIGQAIQQELLKLKERSAEAPSLLPSLEKAALEEMKNSDSNVQSTALTILSSLPPSAESLHAIEEGMINNPDPALTEEAVSEFERYMGTQYESEVQRIVKDIMEKGAHFSSEVAAKKILPFINENSYSEFLSLLQQIPAGTAVYTHLRAALEEYQRQQSGG